MFIWERGRLVTEQTSTGQSRSSVDRYITIFSALIAAASLASTVYFATQASEIQSKALQRDLVQDYAVRVREYPEILSIASDEQRLSALKQLRDVMSEEAKLGGEAFEKLLADVNASITATEQEIKRKQQEAERAEAIAEAETKAREQNDQQAAELAQKLRDEERINAERDENARIEQLRLDAERAAARRMEEKRFFTGDGRICFDEACRNWIIP